MKNYVYDIKYVNAMNFIIVDLLQPVRLYQVLILNGGGIMKK